MEKYLVLNKNKAVEFLCRKNENIILNEKIISSCAKRIISVSAPWENTVFLFYEDTDSYGRIMSVSESKNSGERKILKISDFLQTDILAEEKSMNIFAAEKNNGKIVLKLSTVYRQETKHSILCENLICLGEKWFSVVGSKETQICVFADEKCLDVYILGENRHIFVDEKHIKNYSVCIKKDKIYLLCLLEKGTVLYILEKNGRQHKIDIFKGGKAERVFIFFCGKTVFLCSKEENIIYFRYSQENDFKFSPMGKFYIKNSEKINFISYKNIFGGEIEALEGSAEFIMNLFKKPFEKPISSQEKKKDENIFNLTLSKELEKAVSENSLLNLRFKQIQDRFATQAEELKKQAEYAEKLLSEEKNKSHMLEIENSSLKEENARLKGEINILKKAQKILEDEIYNLNTKAEEYIELPPENITEI